MLASHVGAEHDLTVWNRSPGVAGDLVAAGARLAGAAAEAVEGSEVVITALFGPKAVRDRHHGRAAPRGRGYLD